MALHHEFAIISKNSSETDVSAEMEQVKVPDDLILYIMDTLRWFNFNWHGTRQQPGLAYYGVTIIEGSKIETLKNIIKAWKELFECAPDEFYLTGLFSMDDKTYEKIKYKKREVLLVLDSWIHICEKALRNDAKILHNGI